MVTNGLTDDVSSYPCNQWKKLFENSKEVYVFGTQITGTTQIQTKSAILVKS